MICVWIGVLRAIRLISLWLGAFLWLAGAFYGLWLTALNGAVFMGMGAILFPWLIRELEDYPKP